jgi:hypothetical protein
VSLAGCGGTGGAADDQGQATAIHFLDELRAGRLEPAWQAASTEFKSLMGIENLRDYVKTHPTLRGPAEYTEYRAIERNGRPMAEHIFRATTKVRGKPVSSTIRILLADGNEGWKVEHLSVE